MKRRGIFGAVTAAMAIATTVLAAVKTGAPPAVLTTAVVLLVVVIAAVTASVLLVMWFVLRQAPRDRTVALEVLRVLLGRESNAPEPDVTGERKRRRR